MKKISVKSVKKYLPKKNVKSNKTQSGKTLIIAGSKGLYGAGVLSAKAALRVGSGYVILMSDLRKWNSVKNPDFMTADYKKLKIKTLNFNSVGIGPGLGVNKKTESLIKELVKLNVKNVVVDADALTVIAANKIHPLPSSWVLTPHEGEMARLLGTTSRKVKSSRLSHLIASIKKYRCNVLLKGHKTLIGSKEKVFEIQTGNAALAKAGTGDVLTGMIAGFMAQDLPSLEAALLASTVHGALADKWKKEKKDQLSLTATDLIEMLPRFLYKLR